MEINFTNSAIVIYVHCLLVFILYFRRLIQMVYQFLSAINDKSPHHIKPYGYQNYPVIFLPALLRQRRFCGEVFGP